MAARPLVLDMKTISVSSFQGASPSGARRPPHRSTTFSPRQYAATAAPISPRSSKLRSNSARTSSKPGATNPETSAFELSTALMKPPPSSDPSLSSHTFNHISNLTERSYGFVGRAPGPMSAQDRKIPGVSPGRVRDAVVSVDNELGTAAAPFPRRLPCSQRKREFANGKEPMAAWEVFSRG